MQDRRCRTEDTGQKMQATLRAHSWKTFGKAENIRNIKCSFDQPHQNALPIKKSRIILAEAELASDMSGTATSGLNNRPLRCAKDTAGSSNFQIFCKPLQAILYAIPCSFHYRFYSD